MAQARAAFAHIQPERPKGLPTAEELVKLLYPVIEENSGSFMQGGLSPSWYAWVELLVTETLAALAPWLRDPVSWELDVTSEEMYTAWCKCALDYGPNRMIAVLDLCRSRIRPVFGCKECEKWEKKYQDMNRWHDELDAKLCAARAALDGE